MEETSSTTKKLVVNSIKKVSRSSRKRLTTISNSNKQISNQEFLPTQSQSNALEETELYIIDDESPIYSEIEIKAKSCKAITSTVFHSRISHIVFPHSATNNVPLLKSLFHLIKSYSPTIKLLPIQENDIRYGCTILLCFPWPGEIILQEVFVVSQFWVQECYLQGYRLPESNYISTIFCSLFPRTLNKAMTDFYSLDSTKLSTKDLNFYNNFDNSKDLLSSSSKDDNNKENFLLDSILNIDKNNPQNINLENKFCSTSFSTASTSHKDSITESFHSDITQKINQDKNNLKLSHKIDTSELHSQHSQVNQENSSISQFIPPELPLPSDENISFIDLERNRPDSEIELPKVGDWVETKSTHEDSQIFKARVISIWKINDTWMFRLKSPDIGSTYTEPLKNVRKDNIWSTTLLLELGRGRKSRRSSKSTTGESSFLLTHSSNNNEEILTDLKFKTDTTTISQKNYLENIDFNSPTYNVFQNIKTQNSPSFDKNLNEYIPIIEKSINLVTNTEKKDHDSSISFTTSTNDLIKNDEHLNIENFKVPTINATSKDTGSSIKNILSPNTTESNNFYKKICEDTDIQHTIENNIQKDKNCNSDKKFKPYHDSYGTTDIFNNSFSHLLNSMIPTTDIVESESSIPPRANLNSRLKNGNIQILSLHEALIKEYNNDFRKIFDYSNQENPSPFSLDNHRYFSRLEIKE